jgi:hypothetical protein
MTTHSIFLIAQMPFTPYSKQFLAVPLPCGEEPVSVPLGNVKPPGAHAGGSNPEYDQVRKILHDSDDIPTLEPPSCSRAYRDVAVFGSDGRTANLSTRRGKHYRLSLLRPSIDTRSSKECPGQRNLHWYDIRSFMSLTCTALHPRTMKPTNRMEKVIHAVASPRVYHGLVRNS